MSQKNEELIKKLLKKPVKDKGDDVPHIQVIGPNRVHQADLLYLPSDHGYKYALVVVDLGSRLTDAEPLKSKNSSSVLNAIKKIYSRGPLSLPKKLETDPGVEFKGVFQKFMDENQVSIRYGKVGRHRQQALVERRNQTIAVDIFTHQLIKELDTKKPNKEWVKLLKNKIIPELNLRYKEQMEKKKKGADIPIFNKSSELLMPGQKVRTQLDEPIDLFGKKLIGKFRSTDIRWDPKVKQIDRLILRPNYPPMYLVDNIPYTYNQLQVV